MLDSTAGVRFSCPLDTPAQQDALCILATAGRRGAPCAAAPPPGPAPSACAGALLRTWDRVRHSIDAEHKRHLHNRPAGARRGPESAPQPHKRGCTRGHMLGAGRYSSFQSKPSVRRAPVGGFILRAGERHNAHTVVVAERQEVLISCACRQASAPGRLWRAPGGAQLGGNPSATTWEQLRLRRGRGLSAPCGDSTSLNGRLTGWPAKGPALALRRIARTKSAVVLLPEPCTTTVSLACAAAGPAAAAKHSSSRLVRARPRGAPIMGLTLCCAAAYTFFLVCNVPIQQGACCLAVAQQQHTQ